MSKQTTVRWLVSILNKEGFAPVLTDEEIQQALQMEREQIIGAVNNGCKGMCMIDASREIDTSRDGKHYYNETYGGQDEK